jgi:hypothetical protein
LLPRPGIDKVTLDCYQWDLYEVDYKYAADLIINKGLDAFFNGLDTWYVDFKDYYNLVDMVDVAVFPVISLQAIPENRLKAMIVKNNIIELVKSDETLR